MNCERAQELMLDSAVEADLDAHLDSCARCREFACTARELEAAFEKALVPPSSPQFRRHLRARLDSERPHAWLPLVLDTAATASAAVAAGGLIQELVRAGGVQAIWVAAATAAALACAAAHLTWRELRS